MISSQSQPIGQTGLAAGAATPCAECGRPAEVLLRFSLESTSGPVRHMRTRCEAGHVLTPLIAQPSSRLAAADSNERC